ncbi:MAG TPA: sensor histidine kinase [Candidatus Wunengus sp. YC60]|uniref:sensor histidine kinase n=1 Tax=Candidatus Wunengus sp. YC60 TaxID=3367697 RepID=UPI0040299407
MQRQILEHLKSIAESKRSHIISYIEAKKVRIADFSSDGFIKNRLERITSDGFKKNEVISLNRHLALNKLPLHRYLIAIAVVDKFGKVVASTNEKLIGKDMSKEDVFIQSMGKVFGETTVGQPHHSPDLDANCIFISAPIISLNRTKTLGVIINAYYFSEINKITTDRVGMGGTGEVYLVNRDRIMLTESRFIDNAPFNQIVDTKPLQETAAIDKHLCSIYTDYRGVPVIGEALDIPEYGWTLLAEIDKAEAFAQLKKLGIIAFIFGAIGASAVTGLGIIFAISTSKPINILTNATRKLAEGDLGHRVTIPRNDEFGNLANSFNTMAEELAGVINDHQRAEEKLTQYAAELRRSNEELQHFAYIASHDLQEPLRMISSYLQLIERRYKNKLDADADEFIAFAVDGANRLQTMINALLEYSRIDTHGKPFELVDCNIVLKRALANLKIAIGESGAVITNDSLPTVISDGSQLMQMFQNLIGNAVKFRSNKPMHIHISARQDVNEWLFSVRDNGIGIEPEYNERIFTIFKRLHGREYPGIGLGLSICKKIATRHGGRIWVESEYQNGSIFYFTIPIGGKKQT